MQKKLSYIVPVYNGARYLRPCLDSLYRQGISTEEFEVICIDDHSTDDSVKILQGYAAQYENVRLILHDVNMRTGTSCNQGLQTAQGEYIWIVGQDDWITDHKGLQIVSAMRKEDLDVLPFNYNRVNYSGEKILSADEVFANTQVMQGGEYIRHYFHDTVGVYLLGYEWRAVYKREYLINQHIEFPSDKIYEDTTFLFKALWYAERIKSISDYVYNYRLNDHSITDSVQRYKGYLTYEFSFETSREILELADKIDDKDVVEQLRQTAMKCMKSFAYKVVPMRAKEKKLFYNYVAQSWDEIKIQVNIMPMSYRIMIRPIGGYILATLLKPVFLLKHIFVKRTYMQR